MNDRGDQELEDVAIDALGIPASFVAPRVLLMSHIGFAKSALDDVYGALEAGQDGAAFLAASHLIDIGLTILLRSKGYYTADATRGEFLLARNLRNDPEALQLFHLRVRSPFTQEIANYCNEVVEAVVAATAKVDIDYPLEAHGRHDDGTEDHLFVINGESAKRFQAMRIGVTAMADYLEMYPGENLYETALRRQTSRSGGVR